METIKISDLSVGDWVGIDQAELNMPSDDLATAYIEKLRKPIRIKGISEDSDTVLADIEIVDGWGAIMIKCEHLRPIPITAEILEKNGFEKTAIGDIYRHESDIEVSLYGDGWWHTIGLDEYSLHKINGVHQLQHLLRLYGEYREVNL